jgi:sugar/nucleoside kinase (ribokinase family)
VALLPGEGIRTACAYAALGGAARFAGIVGDDLAGEAIAHWLAERGVETAIQRAGRTPVTTLLAARGHQALQVRGDEGEEGRGGGNGDGGSERGAGALAIPPDTTQPLPDRSEGAILLAGFPFGGHRATAAATLQAARARGLRTVISLSPVALGGAGAPLSPADLEALLPDVDLICGGFAELRRATRRGDAQEAARALIGQGAKSVLAKRGAEGAALFRPGPAALEREDTTTPTAASILAGAGAAQVSPLHVAAAFGAVYDAAYLLGIALNDVSPVRFAAVAAARAATSPKGALGL